MRKANNQNQLGNTAENTAPAEAVALALSAMRRSVEPTLSKVKAPATTADPMPIGELRMVPLAEITIDARFRKDMGDISDLAASIAEVGLLQPILLSPELRLISGMRRYVAHQKLNREELLARVVDIEDETLATIEEDRARKPLTPSEKYAVTEALREKATDEAWRRRALGGRLEEAARRGRVDDVLARHVGISRPTLRKIKEIVEAAKGDPKRYGVVSEALDRDGRVDRHHKEFLEERSKDNISPQFKGILFSPSWQELSAEIASRTAKALKLSGFAAENGFILIPSSIANLSAASEILAANRFRWCSTVVGADSQSENVWLVGTSGKTLPKETEISLVVSECPNGYEKILEAVEIATEGSHLVIDLPSLVRGAA
jgi:ParB-like chromosome segregation protein Spo0J